MKRKLLVKILPPLGFLLILLLRLTCKVRFEGGQNLPKQPLIIAFWHGELLFQPFLYKKIRPNRKIAVMISEHFDGEIIAKIIGFFDFETVRGSGRKNGVKALLAAMKKSQDGYDIAITPDGPKGPRHSVADGIVALAQKKSMSIVAFSIEVDRFWGLSSWDRFVIPKPFSTVVLRAGEPFSVESMSVMDARILISSKMSGDA